MDDNYGTIVLLIVLILCSAFFSATETAFSSMNKIKVKNMANKGNKRAKLCLDIASNFEEMLSTVLIGNNIVNIASASLATILFTNLFGAAGALISTVVMTVVVLIFGEISPKSIAKDMPEKTAIAFAPVINVLRIILKPINFLFGLWKKLLNKIFKTKVDNSITEEEILTFVEEAQSTGSLDEEAGDLIKSAIEFNDLDAIDICVPRIDIVAINENLDKNQIMDVFVQSGFTRLPVYKDTIDNIIGIINIKDFYNKVLYNDNALETIISPIEIISPNIPISKLLERLQQQRTHMALIIDEFGGTLGIITIEDIIEELVGEIWDENEQIINEIEQIADNKYKVLGSANLDKVLDELEVVHETDFVSVNGFVFDLFGRIPKVKETVEFKNLLFTVKKVTDKRILEVEIEIKKQAE